MAAADYADGDSQKPPYELTIGLRCEVWGNAFGVGWMDWPAGLFDKVNATRNVYMAFRAYRRAKNLAKWSQDNHDSYKLVTAINRLRDERAIYSGDD